MIPKNTRLLNLNILVGKHNQRCQRVLYKRFVNVSQSVTQYTISKFPRSFILERGTTRTLELLNSFFFETFRLPSFYSRDSKYLVLISVSKYSLGSLGYLVESLNPSGWVHQGRQDLIPSVQKRGVPKSEISTSLYEGRHPSVEGSPSYHVDS